MVEVAVGIEIVSRVVTVAVMQKNPFNRSPYRSVAKKKELL